jgi:hypothetical protein
MLAAQPPGGLPPGPPEVPPGLIGMGPGGGPQSATVTVDCAAGDSIQGALNHRATDLTIVVSGICEEDVTITRDNVTLEGASGDPDVDGIRGVGSNVPGTAVVRIVDADRITIESLGVLDGLRDGMAAIDVNSLSINDSKVTGHARTALWTLNVNFVSANNSELSSGGFAVSAVGDVRCNGCTINGGSFGWVGFHGQQTITNSTVTSDGFGVWSQTSTSLNVSNTAITISPGGSAAATAFGNASLTLTNSSVDSWLWCQEKSSVVLSGSEQTGGPGFNFFDDDCYVSLSAGSRLLGFQIINHFTRMVIEDTSVVDGDLGCDSGGDAWCPDASINVTGGTCGQCS